jgi:hypothetical protein
MLEQSDSQENILKRVDSLGREMERLKRDLIRNLAAQPKARRPKSSLFGSIKGGDVTSKSIDAAKQALFRPLEDL